MRAVVLDPVNGGGRWELREVPEPDPGPDEVLVRVHAAGLNRADLDERTGAYLPRGVAPDAARIVGSDLAGTVLRLGTALGERSGVAVGDRVMAMVGGAFAERVAVDHRLLLPVPSGMGWAEAAALPSVCLTGHDALVRQGGLRPGEPVLVTGATSAVGLFTTRLAVLGGARPVLAGIRSARHAGRLAELGALPVVTGRGGALAAVREAVGDDGVALVIDHVGGPDFDELIAATSVGGRIVQVGRLGGARTEIDLDQLARRRVRLIGTSFRTRGPELQYPIVTGVREEVLPLLTAGALACPVVATVPFGQAEQAAERLAASTEPGKVVLTLAD